MGIRESLLNTITSVADSDFVRLVTSAGTSSKATVKNLFKGFESNLGAKSSLTTSDYIRVVGSDNEAYKQTLSAVKAVMGVDALNSRFRYVTGVSYDTLTTTGIYYCEAMTDRPSTTYSVYGLIVIATSAIAKQIAFPMSGEAYWYMRHYSSSGWSTWKTITT